MNQFKLQIRYILPLWFVLLITNWLPDNRVSIKIRGRLASPFFKKCGKNLELGSGLTFLNSYNIEVGSNVYIAKGGWFNGMGGLKIADEVVMAPNVVISTMQHVFKDFSVRFGGSIPGKVQIGKGTWLAANSTVKCGVKIGKGCIVAANASVVRDVDDYSIVGGVPAKFIKKVENQTDSFLSRKELMSSSSEEV